MVEGGGLLLGNVFKHVVVTVCYLEICPQRGHVGSPHILKKMIRWGPLGGTILVDLQWDMFWWLQRLFLRLKLSHRELRDRLPNSAWFSVPPHRLPPFLRRPHAAARQVRPGETQTRVVPVPVTFPAMYAFPLPMSLIGRKAFSLLGSTALGALKEKKAAVMGLGEMVVNGYPKRGESTLAPPDIRLFQ